MSGTDITLEQCMVDIYAFFSYDQNLKFLKQLTELKETEFKEITDVPYLPGQQESIACLGDIYCRNLHSFICHQSPFREPVLEKVLSLGIIDGKSSLYTRLQRGFLKVYLDMFSNPVDIIRNGEPAYVIVPKSEHWVTATNQERGEKASYLARAMIDAMVELPFTKSENDLIDQQFYNLIETYCNSKNIDFPRILIDLGVGSEPIKTQKAIEKVLKFREKKSPDYDIPLYVVAVDANPESAFEGASYLQSIFRDKIKVIPLVSPFNRVSQRKEDYLLEPISSLEGEISKLTQETITRDNLDKYTIMTYFGTTAFNGRTPIENLEFCKDIDFGLLVTGVHLTPECQADSYFNFVINSYNNQYVYSLSQLTLKVMGVVGKDFPATYQQAQKEVGYQGNVFFVKWNDMEVPCYAPLWTNISSLHHKLDLLPNINMPVHYAGFFSFKPFLRQIDTIFDKSGLSIDYDLFHLNSNDHNQSNQLAPNNSVALIGCYKLV